MKNNTRREIIQLTKKLISFRSSEFYPQQKEACLEYIEAYFRKIKIPFYLKKLINKRCTAMLIANAKTKTPKLLLNGHIDVVEGNTALFRAKKIGNKIYGRGAIDMKGAVAVVMVLMKRIIQKKIKTRVMLMIVGDEEIPGPKSTEYLLQKFKLKPTFTILGEETNFDIVTQQKGSLNLKIKALGKTAHSAFPEQGINAIEKCLVFYKKISQLPCFTIKDSYKNSIALTYLRGGKTINSIPNQCEMGINIRFISKNVLQSILKFINKYPKKTTDFSINKYYTNAMMTTDRNEKDIQQLKKVAKDVCGFNPRIKKVPTGSDAKYFSAAGLPVVVFGPMGKNYHSNDEWVSIEGLEQYYQILNNFINSLT